MLDKAQVYEMRLSRLKLDARKIFPIEIQVSLPLPVKSFRCTRVVRKAIFWSKR
jgi:hypothetical protein